MTTEFNLSEKECNILTNKIELDKPERAFNLPKESLTFEKGYFKEDVKEFIRLLKEEMRHREFNFIQDNVKILKNEDVEKFHNEIETTLSKFIDKLAGEKLK